MSDDVYEEEEEEENPIMRIVNTAVDGLVTLSEEYINDVVERQVHGIRLKRERDIIDQQVYQKLLEEKARRQLMAEQNMTQDMNRPEIHMHIETERTPDGRNIVTPTKVIECEQVEDGKFRAKGSKKEENDD